MVKWAMRIAVVVFAGLGLLELAVATIFHKVALGTDGAHNLVDGAVYFVNLKAQKWALLERRGIRSCFAEPGSTLFTSGAVVAGAIAFTVYETTSGGGAETHQSLALMLLVLSLLANTTYAAVIAADRRRRFHSKGLLHDRQLRNVLVHAFWDMVSTLISVIGYLLIVLWLPNVFDPIAAWLGTVLIVYGHHNEIPDGWRQIVGHMKRGHPHPLVLASTHHHDHDDHEPGHSHE